MSSVVREVFDLSASDNLITSSELMLPSVLSENENEAHNTLTAEINTFHFVFFQLSQTSTGLKS
jgi:hypothetical protein